MDLALHDAREKLSRKDLKIVLKEFDYGNTDAKVIEAAKKASESDVVGVLGYNFSSHALLAAPIHQKAGLPMLTPSATANRIGTLGAFVHQGCFDNAFMGEALAGIALGRLKAKRAVIIAAVDCAYCTDLSKAFEFAFAKGGGIVSASIPVLQEDKNFEAAYEKIKNVSYDIVVIPNQELLSGRILSFLADKGIQKPMLGGDGWGNVGEELFGILKSKQIVGYSVSHWHPQEPSVSSKKFVKDYKEKYGKEPNDTSVLAYDSMSLLVEAVVTAKSISKEGVEDALAGVKNFSGVTGKFIFSPGLAPRKSLVLLFTEGTAFKVLGRIEPVPGGRQ